MIIRAFLNGLVLAFGLIIPLGVQNIFIFNQGATQPKFFYALPSILTAFLCDTVLILFAVLGFAFLVLQFPLLQTTLLTIGFFFLLYVGFIIWRSPAATGKTTATPLSAKKQIIFALSFSLLNPHGLLDIFGVIGTHSLYYCDEGLWAYTAACILVSLVWFFGLAAIGHHLQHWDKTGKWVRNVNKFSALIILGIAIYIGWQLILLYTP